MAGSAFLVDSSWLKLLLGFTGLMEFTTGVTRYCPVSELLGVENCEGGALKRLTKVESGMTREQAVSIH